MGRPLAGSQRHNLLLPQFALYSWVTLAVFVIVAYISRATLRRVLGALAGGVSFMAFFVAQARLAYSMGWWRYAYADMPQVPWLMFAAGVCCYGAILALIGWRVRRRFCWPGQLTFIGIMTIMGPVRDYMGATMTELIVIAPGLMPVMAWAAFWACNITLMQGVMRLVSGTARSDRLGRSQQDPLVVSAG